MSGIDWAEIELAFINSNKSLKDIAEEFMVGYANVRKKASEGNWQAKRNNSSQLVTKKAQQIAENVRVLQLAEFTQNDLDRCRELQDEIKKLIPQIEKPADLKSLTGSLLDLQKCYRLALGASTENQSVQDVEVFEEWVKEIDRGEVSG